MSPPRGSLRVVISPPSSSPHSGVVRKCLAGAHRGGSLGGGGESGGRGPRGGQGERWRRAEGVFFLFPPERGFVNRSQRVSPWAGRTFFSCPGALRAAWCLRGNSGGSGAGHPGRRRLYCGRAGARRERPGGRERGGWARPRYPRGRRREAESAGARAGHERPVAKCPRLPGLRGDARAGGRVAAAT